MGNVKFACGWVHAALGSPVSQICEHAENNTICSILLDLLYILAIIAIYQVNTRNIVLLNKCKF